VETVDASWSHSLGHCCSDRMLLGTLSRHVRPKLLEEKADIIPGSVGFLPEQCLAWFDRVRPAS